jgi:hypothetical protein
MMLLFVFCFFFFLAESEEGRGCLLLLLVVHPLSKIQINLTTCGQALPSNVISECSSMITNEC